MSTSSKNSPSKAKMSASSKNSPSKAKMSASSKDPTSKEKMSAMSKDPTSEEKMTVLSKDPTSEEKMTVLSKDPTSKEKMSASSKDPTSKEKMSALPKDPIYESDYLNVLRKIDKLLTSQTLFVKSSTPESPPQSPKSSKPRARRVSNPNLPNDFMYQIKILHYQPEEIEVMTDDGFIVIHGKSGEKSDEYGPGFVEREMTRRCKLPDDMEPETVTYCMKDTAEGRILTIMASFKQQEDQLPTNERIVPIVIENPSLER